MQWLAETNLDCNEKAEIPARDSSSDGLAWASPIFLFTTTPTCRKYQLRIRGPVNPHKQTLAQYLKETVPRVRISRTTSPQCARGHYDRNTPRSTSDRLHIHTSSWTRTHIFDNAWTPSIEISASKDYHAVFSRLNTWDGKLKGRDSSGSTLEGDRPPPELKELGGQASLDNYSFWTLSCRLICFKTFWP